MYRAFWSEARTCCGSAGFDSFAMMDLRLLSLFAALSASVKLGSVVRVRNTAL